MLAPLRPPLRPTLRPPLRPPLRPGLRPPRLALLLTFCATLVACGGDTGPGEGCAAPGEACEDGNECPQYECRCDGGPPERTRLCENGTCADGTEACDVLCAPGNPSSAAKGTSVSCS